MSEPQETRIGQKQERIEKPQASSSKPRKVYVLGVAFVATLLLGASFGIMISATTPGFPTVIEPGSMVSGYSFVVFNSGSTYYAKNGTSGSIAYQSASPLTLLTNLIGEMSRGGSIYIKAGDYTLATDLTIETPGITITGDVATMRKFGTIDTKPTRLIGNVNIYSEDIKLKALVIQGVLTFGSKIDLSEQAHYVTVEDCSIYGQVRYEGRSGAADAEVPFNIIFLAGEIRATSVMCLVNMTNLGAPINHLFFYGTTFEQQGTGPIVNISGQFNNVIFTSCLVLAATNPIIQLSAVTATHNLHMVWQGGQIEYDDNATIIRVPASWSGGYLYVNFISVLFAHTVTVVYDTTTSGRIRHQILFDACTFLGTPINFKSGYSSAYPVETLVRFESCSFPQNVVLNQYGPAKMYGEFVNCQNLNPIGIIATPFTAPSSYVYISLKGTQAGPTSPLEYGYALNYTIFDAPVWITSTGGVNVSIKVWDGPNWYTNSPIVSGLTTLNMMYLPIGYSINFGAFDIASPPTVTISFG